MKAFPPISQNKARFSTALRRFDGPETAELVQNPARFGLGQVPERLQPNALTHLICGFCSTGCSLAVHMREDQAVNVSPSVDYPVNLGMACPKGWEALTPLAAPDRATTPLLRTARGSSLRPATWHEALQVFSGRFKQLIAEHGPESIAVLSTGQICTEEMAFLGALFKFGMGGVHADSNTRQCMATSHVAYKESFGYDAPPYTYGDFEESDVIILIGSNLCVAHPILWQRILRNPHHPQIIVVDPRQTETALAATKHLPIAPKSDLTFFYGVARALIEQGAVDASFVAAHTNDFDAFAEFVRPFTREVVLAATRLSPAQFDDFVRSIADGKRVSFWWTMGVNQGHESTRTAQAIINLALLTGHIGRPGTGANSITGQCNAMGSRLFANATSLLGGRDFLNPAHRLEVANSLGFPLERIPARNSMAYDQIVDAINDGRIKGLWVVATNPAHSWIDQTRFQEAAQKLDFLVVQDLFTTTATAQCADLILPAAAWGEKEGTFINSERRIGLVKKVSHAPGMALADFHIFRLVAAYWGCGEMFAQWWSPEAVFQILKRLSVGLPCDISGIRNYQHLEECGGIQWPFPFREGGARPETQRRLFADQRFYHPDGKARFIFQAPRPAPEVPDPAFPFALLTGRGSSAQWHTLTRTDKSEILRRLSPDGLQVQIHPQDARAAGIRAYDLVRISSRRGQVLARALVSASVQRGQIFLPMHDPGVNRLTHHSFDPYSRQPNYKYCAVRFERVEEMRS